MNVYITTGTYDFLKGIQKKYPAEGMVMMAGSRGALLFHETNGASLFKEPRKYEVLDSAGSIKDEGFAALNYIAVTDEGRPVFEHGVKDSLKNIKSEPGFMAVRVLRPLSANTYVILTVWERERDFLLWQGTSSYTKVNDEGDINLKIFSTAPYINTYAITE